MATMPVSRIPASTLQAYRQTDYRVAATRPFSLKIAQASHELLCLHRHAGVCCSAFITACNPYSQLLSPDENALRNKSLEAAIVRGGWSYLLGSGKHISGPWPEEPSFLVLGIDRGTAIALAQAYEQNAFVHSAADGIPELVLLR